MVQRSTAARWLVVAALLATAITGAVRAQGVAIGFEEQFALAEDRAKALEQLIPGTEEHYFYSCLHLQNRGEHDQVDALLKAWIQRYGRTARAMEIETRAALLRYERDPRGTLEFLRRRLGLTFGHQRQVSGMKPDLPTRLDPARIAPAVWAQRALQMHRGSLDGFADSVLPDLAAGDLSDDLLMSWLGRLQRPDVANLPALVVRNLRHRQSNGFGSLGIHRQLLLAQLEECVQLQPSLLEEGAFIDTYLRRLVPGADTEWQRNAAAREAYLERLQAFAQRLTPAHNSLKAHVLGHRLAHDLALGVVDRDRVLAYLRLPRRSGWANPELIRAVGRGQEVVDFDAEFPTQLGAIGDDEQLVRACLTQLLVGEDNYEVFAAYVERDYLRRLFAEVKILAGVGDMERWYSLLDDPVYYERLKERVELNFAPTQQRYFSVDDPVELVVDVKNVDTLLVKVFEINTFNYYVETGKEVDASINLDGLVANSETTHQLAESPLRRVRRHLPLPSLTEPGVYVVELIGNGLSSRAVIHKGRLRYLERSSAAGHLLRVFDERGRHLPDASVWVGGREYAADKTGAIVVPYSTKPGPQPLVLRHGRLASLDHLEHRAEEYHLAAGIHVDREALRGGRMAPLVLRPSLLCNGRPVDLKLLEQPVLRVTARDLDGIATTRSVPGVELRGDRETVVEIAVPDRLAQLEVTLQGRVQSLSRGEKVEVAAPTRTFAVNGIDATALTSCPLLSRSAAGYALDVLGKNGEPKVDVAVQLELRHRDYIDSMTVACKTDERGRIELGELEEITSVRASGFPDGIGAWTLQRDARTYPRRLHGVAGQTLRVPYQGPAAAPPRAVASLLEVRDGAFVRDAIEHVALVDGFIELRDLPAGDYDLWLRQPDARIEVAVCAGEPRGGLVFGERRWLQVAGGALHVTSAALEGEALRIELANAGADARVHVLAGRYLPPFDAFADLRGPGAPALAVQEVEPWAASLHSGREIGDEYRYILERRFAPKLPGNMLRRPGLLLNPWAVSDAGPTTLGRGGGAGGRFGGRSVGGGGVGPTTPGPSRPSPATPPGAFPNLDFLPKGSVLRANLRPDAAGVVVVPLAELGEGAMLHVLATDADESVYTSVQRRETPLAPLDRRLEEALTASAHFAEQRRVELVQGGATAVLADAATARAETYGSLAQVHRLFLQLSGNADLAKFAFILDWPKRSAAEKRQLYSEHACHELHCFLQQKDPEFFAEVVRPYLQSKVHKTFLDEWLLGADLVKYLDPWAFSRLNIVERILLARRLRASHPEVAAGIERHVEELFELIPPDPQRQAVLFDTALAGDALAAATSLGRQLEEAREMRWGAKRQRAEGALADEAERDAAAAQAPAAAAPPAEGKPTLRAALEVAEAEEGYRQDDALEPEALAEDADRRASVRRLYRAPEPTKRYAEHNYWHRRIEEQDASLIKANGFWRDYAAARGDGPFVSPRLAEAAGSFAEMMLALAVLDLPFAADEPTTTFDDGRLTLRAEGPLLLVAKEIVEARPAADAPPILVSQNSFRLDEPYRFVGNERRDAYVTDEFVVGVAYGCRVVVTNPTSTPRRLELLLQIPQGAIPVQRGFKTRGVAVQLGPYGTASTDYAFYFPAPGDVPHYAVQVARDGELVASAESGTMHVVAEPTRVDDTSWQYVSQNASNDEVLRYLEQANLQRTDLARIAWRMRDPQFFSTVLALLRRRCAYNDVLWSYGIHHADEAATREYLRHQDAFLAGCGRFLDAPLVRVDPVERRAYQHLEFAPLFNARAHRFGRQHVIHNAEIAQQYRALLDILAYRPELDATDWMSVTYYLLLQDRFAEAIASFARVERVGLPMELQYDYMRAYLDFFDAEHAVAGDIAARYADYPVERWRRMFADVRMQLDEAGGAEVAAGEGDDPTRQHTALAAAAAALELTVEANRVTLRYANLQGCDVNYYLMDVELLFSTQPFLQQDAGSFAYIRPNRSDRVALPAGRHELTFDLPEELRGSNVLVEVAGGGLVRRQAYYASSLAVRWIESYGQLEVRHRGTDRPLPAVYVKVFARTPGGAVRFHKDGYTDLRGRFDYASVSGEGASDAERLAVMVLSERDGAVIRDVEPPLQ